MNALELLRMDHDRVSDLFDQIDQTDSMQEKRKLFRLIKQELDLHTRIEESVFYPVFARLPEFKDQISDALDEHQEVKSLIQELSRTSDDEKMEDKLDELMDCFENHVDEEENALFPKIERHFNEDQLDQIGSQLEEARKTGTAQAA